MYPDDHALAQMARDLGLDPYPVIFERVPAPLLDEYAAYLMPGRMTHWTYGKQFELLRLGREWGMGKLYELVVNGDPAYAFLLDSASEVEALAVRCHVLAHADFFRHNRCFANTPKDMVERVAQHSQRIRGFTLRFGPEEVEEVLDAALALEEQVDTGDVAWGSAAEPPDLLGYLIAHSAHLEDWERDIVAMVREEAQYLWPQVRTKVANEGWATFWHLKLMRALDLPAAAYLEFARLHASVTAPSPGGLNPYALGLALFERLWAYGGPEAIFLARTVEDDVSLVRNYLDAEVVRRLHLFLWGPAAQGSQVKSRDWREIREALVRALYHGGVPVIEVVEGNFQRRGELYLRHRHEGWDLDIIHAERCLPSVWRLWGRPVHLETVVNGRRTVLSYDGRNSRSSSG